MQSLRAALTGEVDEPDSIESWLLLHQHQLAISQIEQAVACLYRNFDPQRRWDLHSQA